VDVVDRYELQLAVYRPYTPVSTFIYNANHNIHTPLVLDCPHSQRTLRTPMRKLHTLMRKCMSASPTSTPLAPATSVATPTAPRAPPSITGLPRRRDAVAVAPTVSTRRYGWYAYPGRVL